MVKKLKEIAGETVAAVDANGASLAKTVRDSAQQIWLAGLGAFAKTQEEGGKVFEALVKEGKTLESKTRRVAERKFSDATEQIGGKTERVSAKVTASWDRLEQIFEERVARALGRLGVPTQKEIQMLAANVEALTVSVAALTGVPATRRTNVAKKALKPAAKFASKSAFKTAAKPAGKGVRTSRRAQ